MIQYIIYFFALLITFPVFATWFVYFISTKLYKNKWKAIHQTVHWTTFFYIFATVILLNMVYDKYFIGYLLVLLICILALIIIIQWKTNMEIVLIKAFKQLWRVCFLLFSLLYVCLVIIGIYHQIIY